MPTLKKRPHRLCGGTASLDPLNSYSALLHARKLPAPYFTVLASIHDWATVRVQSFL